MSQFGFGTKQQAILDAIALECSDALEAARYVSEVLAYLIERAHENPDATL